MRSSLWRSSGVRFAPAETSHRISAMRQLRAVANQRRAIKAFVRSARHKTARDTITAWSIRNEALPRCLHMLAMRHGLRRPEDRSLTPHPARILDDSEAALRCLRLRMDREQEITR